MWMTAIDIGAVGVAPARPAQIGRAFFPSSDASASLLGSLAAFGAGFLMRPVGALVIGRIGDKAGRKPAMLLSFTLMGVAMTGLALTPPAHRIGVWAPVLAILFRLVQGFALGGEVGSSTAFLVEAAPPRRRGFYVSLQYLGQDLSILCSGLVGFALSSSISAAALDSWGWRVAFLLGASIVPFGLLLRRGLAETLPAPGEVDPMDSPTPGAAPPLPFPALVALGLVILAGGTTVSYVMDYLTTFATQTLHMATNIGFLAPIVLGACGVIMDPVGGWLSDRYGRKPVMLVPCAVLLVATLPGFVWLIHARSAVVLAGVTLLFSLCGAISSSSVLTSVTEGLPRRIRCGALGLIYAFAISIFGGSTQFNVALLTRLTHSPLAPAWYMTAGVALSLAGMLFLRETAPVKLERMRG
jgi:MFS family permease